nr:hypothetical protein [Lignipirellula cremea]
MLVLGAIHPPHPTRAAIPLSLPFRGEQLFAQVPDETLASGSTWQFLAFGGHFAGLDSVVDQHPFREIIGIVRDFRQLIESKPAFLEVCAVADGAVLSQKGVTFRSAQRTRPELTNQHEEKAGK